MARPDASLWRLWPILALSAVGGCPGCEAADDAGVSVAATSGSPQLPPASPKAQVRFKNGARLQLELARVLDIDKNELCRELGLYECFGIHSVVLGDADAFGIGLYEPLPATTKTTPLAIDRIVLSACAQRAKIDLSGAAKSIIFASLPLKDGKLLDVGDAAVAQTIHTLYQRALGRNAKASEIAHHQQLYSDIEAKGLSATPAGDWAILSCYAVLTTVEMLFY
jgi:hypothetical protein